ncbi:MFS transporter [Chachezhania sediminis]|uniref:MFS transporter n=1 Tax=Chachezhania sediminis TaxID=2599291 RepID=UPI00131CEB25|nr:MFS transporter [Chachezhania sediminis]
MISAKTKVISALGAVQILTWGSTFYLMAPLSGPISAATGWSMGFLSAGVSLALLVSGIAAPYIGRWIGRTGGRQTLAAGVVLVALGLAMLGLSQGPVTYLAAWAIMGLGMSCCLYDAAFSTLGTLYGREARAAITQLTLWGGFASTVCWPLTAWAMESLGWRATCLMYAGIHLGLTLPLCLVFLPRSRARAPVPSRGTARVTAQVTAAPVGTLDLRFLCIVAAGITLSMLSTIWSVHMVTILTAGGLSLAAAIGLGALIGPSQVGARVLEMLGRGRHHPIWTLGISTALVLVGFGGLQFGLPAALALIAYGGGNGLWSIARGALPLALFGEDGYAATMGRLARPMLFAGAAAPSVGGLMIERLGPDRTMTALAVLALIPVVAAVVLTVRVARDRRGLPA